MFDQYIEIESQDIDDKIVMIKIVEDIEVYFYLTIGLIRQLDGIKTYENIFLKDIDDSMTEIDRGATLMKINSLTFESKIKMVNVEFELHKLRTNDNRLFYVPKKYTEQMKTVKNRLTDDKQIILLPDVDSRTFLMIMDLLRINSSYQGNPEIYGRDRKITDEYGDHFKTYLDSKCMQMIRKNMIVCNCLGIINLISVHCRYLGNWLHNKYQESGLDPDGTIIPEEVRELFGDNRDNRDDRG